jgi:hypothetical protein
MTQQRVPRCPDDVRAALVDQAKQQLENDIMTAMCDTTAGRVRGRYLMAIPMPLNGTHTTA